MSIVRHGAGNRMSQAVVYNGTVYLAGMVSGDAADVKGQTAGVLKKIDDALKAAGTDKSKLLTATIYLTDIKKWAEMNEVWDKWVAPGNNTPARATVQAQLADPKYLVEIMVVAAL